MSLRLYLIFMIFGTVLCWAAWGVVIHNIDPATAGLLGLSFFYLSLFLALVGSASVVGFVVKMSMLKDNDVIFRHTKRNFRQSIIFALLVTLCLGLLRSGWLHWWSAVLIVLLGLTIEGMFFSKRKFSNIEV